MRCKSRYIHYNRLQNSINLFQSNSPQTVVEIVDPFTAENGAVMARAAADDQKSIDMIETYAKLYLFQETAA